MKTSILFIGVALISSAAFAQKITHQTAMKEGVLKREGKIWYIKALPDSMTLDNGMVIYADGSIKNTNNKTYALKDGDRMDFEGVIADADKKIDDKRALLVMNNHSMWVWTILDKPISLSNGTYVMPDGTLRLKTGKYIKLKNKYFIDLDGNIAMVSR